MQLQQLPRNKAWVCLQVTLSLALVANPQATSSRTLLYASLVAPQQQQNQYEPHRHHLRARVLLRDFEQDDHEVYNLP
jgi:hypothetical protein